MNQINDCGKTARLISAIVGVPVSFNPIKQSTQKRREAAHNETAATRLLLDWINGRKKGRCSCQCS